MNFIRHEVVVAGCKQGLTTASVVGLAIVSQIVAILSVDAAIVCESSANSRHWTTCEHIDRGVCLGQLPEVNTSIEGCPYPTANLQLNSHHSMFPETLISRYTECFEGIYISIEGCLGDPWGDLEITDFHSTTVCHDNSQTIHIDRGVCRNKTATRETVRVRLRCESGRWRLIQLQMRQPCRSWSLHEAFRELSLDAHRIGTRETSPNRDRGSDVRNSPAST